RAQLAPPPRQKPDDPEEDDSEHPPTPEIPSGHPMAHLFKQPRIPEEYADLYEARDGYANYRFNLVARDRIVDEISRLGEFPDGAWKITGTSASGESFELNLNDEVAALTLGAESFLQNVDEPFRDEPPGTGGLLAAMHHLRQMLIAPEDRFTEFYYLGSEPLEGDGETVEVLIATRGSMASRWYFRQSDGAFIGYDTEIEPDADPCELRIMNWKTIEGRTFPAEIAVRHAGGDLGKWSIDGLTFREANR
ncbi:MAG: hypothetical protein KDA52_24335, partial [Planctomycetaceae bacterium]|nr:hypothetical protein [Planctomycetaceae bacterium]